MAWLGQAYAAQGDFPTALRTLDKAIAIIRFPSRHTCGGLSSISI